MENMVEPIITIKDLKMNYGEKEVLRGINLNVGKGQIIGYIGPNGAGKSTTVKIMLGLVEGFTGEVKILGQDILNGSVEYKRKIGYVPEVADIYDSLTAEEYLTFVAELYGICNKVIHDAPYLLLIYMGKYMLLRRSHSYMLVFSHCLEVKQLYRP